MYNELFLPNLDMFGRTERVVELQNIFTIDKICAQVALLIECGCIL